MNGGAVIERGLIGGFEYAVWQRKSDGKKIVYWNGKRHNMKWLKKKKDSK